MAARIAALLFSILVFPAAAQNSTKPSVAIPESCPVTKPPDPAFVPPPRYEATAGFRGTLAGGDNTNPFWFGSPMLWTIIWPHEWSLSRTTGYNPRNPKDHTSLREKLFWWSDGLDWRANQTAEFNVTGKRIDGTAPPLITDGPGNPSSHEGMGSFFVVGINIPTTGCWEITGHYKGNDLSYVIWVVP